MGGLAGHIKNIQDDLDLTFRDLRDIVDGICSNELQTFEKVDGINMLFTWDESIGEVKIARNQKHVRVGLNRWNIAREFADNSAMLDVSKSFITTISHLLANVPTQDRVEIFGHSGQIWYSCEIVDPKYPNAIHYEQNVIAVHHGARVFNTKGKLISFTNDDSDKKIFKFFNGNVDDWKIIGPIELNLKQDDFMVAKRACDELVGLYRGMGISGLATQRRWHMIQLEEHGKNFSTIQPIIRETVVKSILGYSGVPTKARILKGFQEKHKQDILKFWDSCLRLIAKNKERVEDIFFNLGKVMLKDLCSGLLSRGSRESINNLRQLHIDNIAAIQADVSPRAKNILSYQGKKIKTIEDIDCCIEGFVFFYKEKVFKLTGIFAPINRLNGYLKYSSKIS